MHMSRQKEIDNQQRARKNRYGIRRKAHSYFWNNENSREN